MNSTDKVNAVLALKGICDAVIESVRTAGKMGLPGGTVYAALMTHGCDIQTYEQIMAALVTAGKLEKRGQLYFVTEAK